MGWQDSSEGRVMSSVAFPPTQLCRPPYLSLEIIEMGTFKLSLLRIQTPYEKVGTRTSVIFAW